MRQMWERACLPSFSGESSEKRGTMRAPCGHGQQLQLHAAHPAHGRQLARHQQVIRLIVEPPAQQINLKACLDTCTGQFGSSDTARWVMRSRLSAL